MSADHPEPDQPPRDVDRLGRTATLDEPRQGTAVALEIFAHAVQPFDLRGSDQPRRGERGFLGWDTRTSPSRASSRSPEAASSRAARRTDGFEHLVQRTRRYRGGLGSCEKALVDQAGHCAERFIPGRRTLPAGKDGRGRVERKKTRKRAEASGGRRAARSRRGADSSRRPSHSSSVAVRGDRVGRWSRAGRRVRVCGAGRRLTAPSSTGLPTRGRAATHRAPPAQRRHCGTVRRGEAELRLHIPHSFQKEADRRRGGVAGDRRLSGDPPLSGTSAGSCSRSSASPGERCHSGGVVPRARCVAARPRVGSPVDEGAVSRRPAPQTRTRRPALDRRPTRSPRTATDDECDGRLELSAPRARASSAPSDASARFRVFFRSTRPRPSLPAGRVRRPGMNRSAQWPA